LLTRFIRTDEETVEGTVGPVLIDILMRLDPKGLLQLDQPRVDPKLETILIERLPVHIPSQLSWALADRDRLWKVVQDQKITMVLQTLETLIGQPACGTERRASLCLRSAGHRKDGSLPGDTP
jgi:hypothetical protein